MNLTPPRIERTGCRGTTLVEVILGAAIIGIMAIATLISLFYPRYSVVTGGYKRLATQTGSVHLEELAAQPFTHILPGDQPIPSHAGSQEIGGRTVTTQVYRVEAREETIPGAPGSTMTYLYIRTEVAFPNGEDPVVLETYRSPLR
jgi:hypothetical protein